MPNLVLFEPYPVVSGPADKNRPEPLIANHVSAEPLVTTARITKVIKPCYVRIKAERRQVTVDIVGRKERAQVTGKAGPCVSNLVCVISREIAARFTEIKTPSALLEAKDGKVFLCDKELPVIEPRDDFRELTRPRKTVDASNLLKALTAASEYTGPVGRYDIHKILLDPDGPDLRVVGTDLVTMSHNVMKDAAQALGLKHPVLLEWSNVLALPVFTKARAVTAAFTQSVASFITGDVIWQELIEKGRFPRYRDALPDTKDWSNCPVDASALGPVLDVLKKAKKETKLIELMFDDKSAARFTVSGETANLTLPIRGYTGKPRVIKFRPELLMRGLTLSGLQALSISPSITAPCMFQNGTAVALVMPAN